MIYQVKGISGYVWGVCVGGCGCAWVCACVCAVMHGCAWVSASVLTTSRNVRIAADQANCNLDLPYLDELELA